MNATEKMMTDGFGKQGYFFPTIHLMDMGTGTGKTYFIVNSLIPKVLREGKRLLYLCNRTALRLQVCREIGDTYGDTINETSPMTNGYYGVGTPPAIIVQTYQNLERLVSNGFDWIYEWGYFDYIVADECHYFVQDTSFNPYTYLSFEAIFSQRCQIFFMSATMDEFRAIIYQRVSFSQNNYACAYDAMLHIKEHIIEDKFDGIDAVYFHEISEIVSKINASKKGEKWLVFVESKSLAKELDDVIDMNSCIITADDKNSKEFELITRQEQFHADVLITTSVIDNGVNIKDLNLRHLVLMTSEKVEFLQMLGRKRRVSGEKVTVYIQALKKELLQKRIRKLTDLLDFGNHLLFQATPALIAGAAIRYRNDWRSRYFICHCFDWRTGLTQIITNNLSVFHCQWLLNEHKAMLQKIEEDPDMAFRIPLSWIKQENEMEAVTCLGSIATKLLDSMLGIDCTKEELQKKLCEFVPIVEEFDKKLVQNGRLSKQNFKKYLERRHPEYSVDQYKSSDRTQRYRLKRQEE